MQSFKKETETLKSLVFPEDKEPKPVFSSHLNITYVQKTKEWCTLTQAEQTP